MLDLGCGDGILTHELLMGDDSISVTLVDGSGDLLRKAYPRLSAFGNVRFGQAGFQDLLYNAAVELPRFDLAISSLAIHLLPLSENKSLFAYATTFGEESLSLLLSFSCYSNPGGGLNPPVIFSINLATWMGVLSSR